MVFIYFELKKKKSYSFHHSIGITRRHKYIYVLLNDLYKHFNKTIRYAHVKINMNIVSARIRSTYKRRDTEIFLKI